MNDRVFAPGQEIAIRDKIDPENVIDEGSIVYVEDDAELGLQWIYMRNNLESKNIHTDPKFPQTYDMIIESISDRII